MRARFRRLFETRKARNRASCDASSASCSLRVRPRASRRAASRWGRTTSSKLSPTVEPIAMSTVWSARASANTDSARTEPVQHTRTHAAARYKAHETWPFGVIWRELRALREAGASPRRKPATIAGLSVQIRPSARSSVGNDGGLKSEQPARAVGRTDLTGAARDALVGSARAPAHVEADEVTDVSLQLRRSGCWPPAAPRFVCAASGSTPSDRSRWSSACRRVAVRRSAGAPAGGPALRRTGPRRATGLPSHAANGPTVTAICRRLDALPLALELAAPWIKVLTAEDLLRRLAHDVLLLGGRPARSPRTPADDERDGGAGAISSSAPSEQRVFRRLGALPGRFPIEAAAAVLAGRDGSRTGATRRSRGGRPLIDKSLLLRAETSVATRPLYRMLETVRAFAALELAAAGERDDALDGLARYCARKRPSPREGWLGLRRPNGWIACATISRTTAAR